MKLYIVRHDRAIESRGGVPDALRHLTAKGRACTRATARAARDAGMAVDAIVTSPMVRAVQTADLLAEGLGYVGAVAADPELARGIYAPDLPVFLEPYADCRGLAIVGHNPHLTGLVGELLGLSGNFCMKKGSIVAIDLPGGKRFRDARYLWMSADGKIDDAEPE
ncbi:MAG TPA: histidine phosphatase family protein [Candidatus Deferrimicrobiaceae bacterium]